MLSSLSPVCTRGHTVPDSAFSGTERLSKPSVRGPPFEQLAPRQPLKASRRGGLIPVEQPAWMGKAEESRVRAAERHESGNSLTARQVPTAEASRKSGPTETWTL